ncbi:hypothetical protein [Burkholderia cenocepacia]|uniref:hypothetical protein n=1 Tax=Burkholderia cenocepacia TaxID=95486 RepID=UPI002AC3317F|nr:hypothetical protein [Burkholderia cenocepacia]
MSKVNKSILFSRLQEVTAELFQYLIENGEDGNKEIKMMANYLYKKQVQIIKNENKRERSK